MKNVEIYKNFTLGIKILQKWTAEMRNQRLIPFDLPPFSEIAIK